MKASELIKEVLRVIRENKLQGFDPEVYYDSTDDWHDIGEVTINLDEDDVPTILLK